jgi:ferrochelatase
MKKGDDMIATPSPEAHRLNGTTPPRRKGVLLLNLGTPDAPETKAVRRYLTEFLSDPEVIRLPRQMRWFNWPLARMIAQFRSAKSAHAYRAIWTEQGSPLKVITEQQAAALRDALPKGWHVFYAMRYGNPSVSAALDEIVAAGITDLVVVPMYPQFSGPTTGTAMDDLYRRLRKRGQQINLTVRNCWFDDAGYVDAQAQLLKRFIEENDLSPNSCVLVYSAHSMPKSYIDAGDPYQSQILRSVELITQRLGWWDSRTKVAYQSKLGPVPWLEPSTEQTLLDLAEAGEANVLVCPLSFTADCLESLEEIGMGYREQFEAHGGRLHLAPALNGFEPFIKALAQLVLRGPKPIGEGKSRNAPLIRFQEEPEPAASGIDALVMIGASLDGRFTGSGHGPSLKHVTPEQFQCVKRPHEEVNALLKELRSTGDFAECFLWNTCSRFEFYGWMTIDPLSAKSDQVLARTLRSVIGPACEQVPVNVLTGNDALHHLLRTAAGLNSGLPGDAEVANQLDVARRIAERCGTADVRVKRLMHEVLDAQHALRDNTGWGRFRPEYCPVAMRRVAVEHSIDFSTANCVVIGGSVTAGSVLNAFREHAQVPPERLTLIHRSQSRGAQLKRLKAAVEGGTRLRVDQYDDPRVAETIADADVVVFAIDRREPIFALEQIAGMRDLETRPLIVLDFNTFDSTSGLDGAADVMLFDAQHLDREVARYADGLCQCPAFHVSTEEAERWIELLLPSGEKRREPAPVLQRPAGPPLNGSCGCSGQESKVCPCPRESDTHHCPKRLLAERIAS